MVGGGDTAVSFFQKHFHFHYGMLRGHFTIITRVVLANYQNEVMCAFVFEDMLLLTSMTLLLTDTCFQGVN